jgi:hypothetical protein
MSMTDKRPKFNPDRHRRRSIRLKTHDYTSGGAYFVTICVRYMACLFGTVIDDEIQLNAAGEMVESEWMALPERFPQIELDEFMVMPNHFHAILVISDELNRPQATSATIEPINTDPTEPSIEVSPPLKPVIPTLGDMIGAF